ncbi:hypothetical protein FJY63_06180, partial [Candidatus Sumerlaeota bacterium]|nr:hypothetical protein [Candidatus Sumerlaeota bacterium]
DTGTLVRNAANEYRYSLNSLLGLNKVRKQGVDLPWNLEGIYARYVRDVGRPYVNPANAAMTMWVAAELGIPLPAPVNDRVAKYLENPQTWRTWEAQAFGWMILSLVASATPNDLERAAKLVRFVLERLRDERTGLFRYCSNGFRKNQASFGGMAYLTWALLRYGRRVGERAALDAGLAACRSLIELQGPQGQWPWMINVRSATVSDWYQVYSVHQDAMAPLFLLEALDLGCPEAREAIMRGFNWIVGENEMGQNMVCNRHSMIYRSVIRKGRFEKAARFVRMLRSDYLRYRDRIASAEHLRINPECRSYHLGWMLYAFSDRSDFGEITNHEAFLADRAELARR